MKTIVKECLLGFSIAFVLLLAMLIMAFHVKGTSHLDSIQDLLRLLTIVLSTPIYFVVALVICIRHGIWSLLLTMLLSVFAAVAALQILKRANPIKLRYTVATYLVVIGGVGAYAIRLIAY